MLKKIRVAVTEDHIKLNKKDENSQRSLSCPIAKAIKPLLKAIYYPSIADKLYIDLKKSDIIVDMFDLPKSALTFINRFDTQKEVKPFVFDIKIDEKYLNAKTLKSLNEANT